MEKIYSIGELEVNDSKTTNIIKVNDDLARAVIFDGLSESNKELFKKAMKSN